MKNKISRLALLGLVFLLSGCGSVDSESSPSGESGAVTDSGAGSLENEEQGEEIALKTYSWDEAVIYEAEAGKLLGGTKVNDSGGAACVDGFVNDTD